MSFTFIHMQKIKGNGVTGMQIHNQREKESDTNIDIKKELSHLNYDLENESPIDYNEKIKGMIDERVDQSNRKVRKDAVKIASFLVTSDKGYFDRVGEKEEKRYFETAYKFIQERYGKENIAYAIVHKDEKTPHMHVGFIPITEDNRLSAKDFFGKKQQLHQLQDDFHAHIKEKGFDLERGLSSDKKHLETAQFKLQTVQEKTKDLEENLEKIEQIDEFDEKIKEGRFTNKVTINKEDFEAFKNVAKAGIVTLDENKLLEAKLDDLKASNSFEVHKLQTELKQAENERDDVLDDNEKLSKENNELKHENTNLKQQNKVLDFTIEGIKQQFKDKFKDFGKSIGKMKAFWSEKLYGEMVKGITTEKDELEGINEHAENKKQKEKQNEKQDEQQHEME